jgi:hypothetical protein
VGVCVKSSGWISPFRETPLHCEEQRMDLS